jgi:hypothetical protein
VSHVGEKVNEAGRIIFLLPDLVEPRGRLVVPDVRDDSSIADFTFSTPEAFTR